MMKGVCIKHRDDNFEELPLEMGGRSVRTRESGLVCKWRTRDGQDQKDSAPTRWDRV